MLPTANALLKKRLWNAPLDSLANKWIFEIESLTEEIRNVIEAWIDQNAPQARSVVMKNFPMTVILSNDVIRHGLSFLEDEKDGANVLVDFAPISRVNKTLNTLTLPFQQKAFQHKDWVKLAPLVTSENLMPFVARMRPEIIFDLPGGEITKAAFQSFSTNDVLQIVQIDHYGLQTGLIDPTIYLFRRLTVIEGDKIQSAIVLDFLERLTDEHLGRSHEIPLREFNVQMLNDGTDPAEVASFLPPSLKTFPMPCDETVRRADSWAQLALTKCSHTTSFCVDRQATVQFSESTLRCLSHRTNLSHISLTVAETMRVDIAAKWFCQIVKANVNLTQFEVRFVKKLGRRQRKMGMNWRDCLPQHIADKVQWRANSVYYLAL